MVDEKKRELFLNQKDTLDKFLERGAITKAQYDKSLYFYPIFKADKYTLCNDVNVMLKFKFYMLRKQ